MKQKKCYTLSTILKCFNLHQHSDFLANQLTLRTWLRSQLRHLNHFERGFCRVRVYLSSICLEGKGLCGWYAELGRARGDDGAAGQAVGKTVGWGSDVGIMVIA